MCYNYNEDDCMEIREIENKLELFQNKVNEFWRLL